MVINALPLNARVIQLIVQSAQARVNRQPTIFNSFFVQINNHVFVFIKKRLLFSFPTLCFAFCRIINVRYRIKITEECINT